MSNQNFNHLLKLLYQKQDLDIFAKKVTSTNLPFSDINTSGNNNRHFENQSRRRLLEINPEWFQRHASE